MFVFVLMLKLLQAEHLKNTKSESLKALGQLEIIIWHLERFICRIMLQWQNAVFN